jgi:hypothetical protein
MRCRKDGFGRRRSCHRVEDADIKSPWQLLHVLRQNKLSRLKVGLSSGRCAILHIYPADVLDQQGLGLYLIPEDLSDMWDRESKYQVE